MTTFSVVLFGTKLVTMENMGTAMRYAQAIREGLWQCSKTGEPWKYEARHLLPTKTNLGGTMYHHCNGDCLDTRTDDDVQVVQED